MNRLTWIAGGVIAAVIGGFFAILQADESHVHSSLPYFNPNPERKELCMTAVDSPTLWNVFLYVKDLREEEQELVGALERIELRDQHGDPELYLGWPMLRLQFKIPFDVELTRQAIKMRLNRIRWTLSQIKMPEMPEVVMDEIRERHEKRNGITQNENVYRAE